MAEIAQGAGIVLAIGASLYGTGYVAGYLVAVLKGFSAELKDDDV